MAASLGLPIHPYLLLALPDDAPSREVARMRVQESDAEIAVGGSEHPELQDLRTLICAPVTGLTTVGKVLELPPPGTRSGARRVG